MSESGDDGARPSGNADGAEGRTLGGGVDGDGEDDAGGCEGVGRGGAIGGRGAMPPEETGGALGVDGRGGLGGSAMSAPEVYGVLPPAKNTICSERRPKMASSGEKALALAWRPRKRERIKTRREGLATRRWFPT